MGQYIDMSFYHMTHYKFQSHPLIEYHDILRYGYQLSQYYIHILISVADVILNDYCVLQLLVLQLNNFREQIKTMSI